MRLLKLTAFLSLWAVFFVLVAAVHLWVSILGLPNRWKIISRLQFDATGGRLAAAVRPGTDQLGFWRVGASLDGPIVCAEFSLPSQWPSRFFSFAVL